MRRVLPIIAFLLLFPFITDAAIVVQHSMSTTTPGETGVTITLGFTASAGDTLVIAEGIRSSSASCSASSTGATWVLLFTQAAASGVSSQCMFYAVNIGSSVTTVSVSSSASVVKAITILDISGINNSTPVDASSTFQGASAAAQNSATSTTANANDIIIGAVTESANNGTTYASAGPTALTGGGSWTSAANISNNGGNPGSIGIATGYQIVSSAASYTTGWTANTIGAFTGGSVALQAASAPPPPASATRRRQPMIVGG